MSEILDPEFNAFVLRMAESIPYDPAPGYTASFEGMRATYRATGRIPINTDFSEGTIFGDPAINWAFRAWHDWAHIRGNYDFTEEGEKHAAELQKRDVNGAVMGGYILPSQGWRFRRLIDCEVNGQVQYQLAHNAFPSDQMAFAKEYLSCKN
jgi:hypothetical protein